MESDNPCCLNMMLRYEYVMLWLLCVNSFGSGVPSGGGACFSIRRASALRVQQIANVARTSPGDQTHSNILPGQNEPCG